MLRRKISSWPKKMAQRFVSLLSKIKKLVLEQTARENDGEAHFVEGVAAVAESSNPIFEHCLATIFQRRHIAYRINSSNNQIPPVSPAGSYKIPTTSLSGLFAILFQPKGRGSRDEELFEPIKVIFSLKNLYLLGFVYEEVFYQYKDTDVSEIAVTEETKRFIMKIDMDGGYFGNDLCEVKIGISGLWRHYDTLINAKDRTRRQVRQALMSIFIPVAEGIRFSGWLCRLHEIYIKNLDITTDEDDKKYSQNFNDWDSISHGVARGQTNFKAVASYNSFVVLLMQSSMVLQSAVKSANEKNKDEQQEELRRQKEERKSKGKKKMR